MGEPVNFDSASLEVILSDWLAALGEFSVTALTVLGPDPFGGDDDRQVVAVHPSALADAAHALARSRDFGADWRATDGPLVAWQTLARAAPEDSGSWRVLWQAQGLRAVVRIAFSLPAGRAFECFLFSPRPFNGREEAAAVAWSALNIWPIVKRGIAFSRSTLTPRERDCLQLAFQGLTARDTAGRLACTERTVNYHLANAMAKMKVDNKMAAIQRACWLGAL